MLDSKNATLIRENGSTAFFNITGGLESVSSSEIQSAQVQLLQFQGTHSIYNITDDNNTLEVLVQKTNIYETVTYTNMVTKVSIPNGNYNVSQLTSALNTALLAANTATLASQQGYYYSGFGVPAGKGAVLAQDAVTFNATSGTMTFHLPNTSTTNLTFLNDNTADIASCFPSKYFENYQYGQVAPTITNVTAQAKEFMGNIYTGFYVISNNYTGLLKTLGFDLAYTKTLSHSTYTGFGITMGYSLTTDIGSGANAYIEYFPLPSWIEAVDDYYSIDPILGNFGPSHIVDLSYPRCIYVSVSGMSTHNRTSTPQESFGSIFACIPVKEAFGDQILYEPTQTFSNLCPNFQLSSLQIRTVDEDGKPIHWHNGCWRIVIGIQWAIDLGVAGLQDVTGSRTYRPMLHNTPHDPLLTRVEHENLKRIRKG